MSQGSPTTSAASKSPSRHSFYQSAEGVLLQVDSMMDQLLAPSMDESMNTTSGSGGGVGGLGFSNPTTPSASPDRRSTTVVSPHEMQSVWSAVHLGLNQDSNGNSSNGNSSNSRTTTPSPTKQLQQQPTFRRSPEEKKIDHYLVPLSSGRSPASRDGVDGPSLNSSFDRALGEIGNEFEEEEHQVSAYAMLDVERYDDARQDETASMMNGTGAATSSSFHSAQPSASRSSAMYPPSDLHIEQGIEMSFDDDASSTLSPHHPSSSLESRRYNDILGLLRNRRQELAAALQHKPPDAVMTKTDEEEEDEDGQENREQNDEEKEINRADSETKQSSLSNSSSEEPEQVQKKEGKESAKSSTVAPVSSIEEKPSDEVAATSSQAVVEIKSGQVSSSPTSEDISATTTNNDSTERDDKLLQKIDSAPQETEDERRRRQQNSTPTRRHIADLNAISTTPPRSPHRTLPYFYKPSGVTPPASPTFGSLELSPSRVKARPDLSPKALAGLSPRSRGGSKSPLPKSPPRSPPKPTTTISPPTTTPSLDLPTLATGAAANDVKEEQSATTSPNQPDEDSSKSQTTPPAQDSSSPKRLTAETLAAVDESPSTPKASPKTRSEPGVGTRNSAFGTAGLPPPRRRPDSPKSEVQGPSSSSPFSVPRSSPTSSKRFDAAAMAALRTIPRSSPPKSSAPSSSSPRKSSPFRNGTNITPKKPVPPDKIRFRDPYPILRPDKQPRDPKDIIAEHTFPKEHLPIRWVRPKQDLKQLIVAAMGPSLTRRSNACGALKVLTQNKKNQVNLFRTDSFMSSLVFCATQDITVKERDVALDARTRAVACIKAVCEPKANRYHVVTFPGILDCLAKVIQTDNGESRSLACGALALIAKTSDCREEIAKDFRLVKLLAQVLGNRVPVPIPSPVREEKKEEPISPHSHEADGEQTDEEYHTDDEHTEISRHPEESTIGDYDTAFAGSIGDMLNESFDMHSRGNPQSPRAESSDEENSHHEEEASYDSEPDAPVTDSIRKKNLERNQAFVQESRASACAVLLHLSRECPLSPLLCNNHSVLDNMILVANETSNSIHTRCLEFLFNLTRFPANNVRLTPYEGLLGTLLSLGNAELQEDRLLSLQILQNLSADQASKAKLAIDSVLTFLTTSSVRKDDAEREAAVSTLQNISTEPGAVVAITNTKNAIATLVHLAHSKSTRANTRNLACETLANISLWLQTLAGTGKVPEGVENVLLPTLKTSGWEKWD